MQDIINNPMNLNQVKVVEKHYFRQNIFAPQLNCTLCAQPAVNGIHLVIGGRND